MTEELPHPLPGCKCLTKETKVLLTQALNRAAVDADDPEIAAKYERLSDYVVMQKDCAVTIREKVGAAFTDIITTGEDW